MKTCCKIRIKVAPKFLTLKVYNAVFWNLVNGFKHIRSLEGPHTVAVFLNRTKMYFVHVFVREKSIITNVFRVDILGIGTSVSLFSYENP